VSRFDTVFSPEGLVVGFGVLTVVALIVAASTSTAAFGIYNGAWDGTAELQDTATSTGATTTIARETTEYAQTSPNETISVILSPEQAYTQREQQRIESFVRNGGTLVVAGDYGEHGNELLAGLNAEARFDGQPLRDEQSNYRSPAIPVATDVTNRSIVANVSALTLNHGTAVRPNNASVLVGTSEYAYLDSDRNETLDANEVVRSYPVVTTEELGRGTLIAVGDPSLFINTMLDQSDNRAFARTLFATHSHVVLDYSHTASLPPLAVALLLIRNAPLLQFFGGAVSVLVIFSILRTDVLRTLKRTVAPPQVRGSDLEVSDEELAAYLRTRHPDWEDDRIQRVVAARRNAADDDSP